jgi:hypothetical protein
VRAGGNVGENISSGAVGERRDSEGRDLHPSAFEHVARGRIADGASDYAELSGVHNGQAESNGRDKEREQSGGCMVVKWPSAPAFLRERLTVKLQKEPRHT